MLVVKLSPKHTNLLDKFCEECSQAGYTNNASLSSLKLLEGHDLPCDPQYWALIVDGEIASISGCHSYDSEHQTLRCLFRSATLPRYSGLIPGISKTHMNSVPFSLLLPQQIWWGGLHGYTRFYITTSHGDHDASGHMWRTHRALELLAKQGIVDFVRQEEYYYTAQTIWQINVDRYMKAVDVFKSTSDIKFSFEDTLK
jgi:hypothetical protein